MFLQALFGPDLGFKSVVRIDVFVNNQFWKQLLVFWRLYLELVKVRLVSRRNAWWVNRQAFGKRLVLRGNECLNLSVFQASTYGVLVLWLGSFGQVSGFLVYTDVRTTSKSRMVQGHFTISYVCVAKLRYLLYRLWAVIEHWFQMTVIFYRLRPTR